MKHYTKSNLNINFSIYICIMACGISLLKNIDIHVVRRIIYM